MAALKCANFQLLLVALIQMCQNTSRRQSSAARRKHSGLMAPSQPPQFCRATACQVSSGVTALQAFSVDCRRDLTASSLQHAAGAHSLRKAAIGHQNLLGCLQEAAAADGSLKSPGGPVDVKVLTDGTPAQVAALLKPVITKGGHIVCRAVVALHVPIMVPGCVTWVPLMGMTAGDSQCWLA